MGFICFLIKNVTLCLNALQIQYFQITQKQKVVTRWHKQQTDDNLWSNKKSYFKQKAHEYKYLVNQK